MFASGPPPWPLWPLLLLLVLVLLHSPSPLRPRGVAAADRRYDHHVLGASMAWPDPYDARAVIHSRFQVTRDGRVILASPRFRPGVPFTLGSFRATTARRAVVEPDVRPLPSDPRLHRVEHMAKGTAEETGSDRKRPEETGAGAEGDPSASRLQPPSPLINVVDLCLDDAMDVLWLLDVGTVDTMTDSPRRVAPAKIVRLEIDENDVDDDDDDCIFDPKNPYRTYEIRRDGDGDDWDASCLQYLVTYRSRAADGHHYAFVSDAGRGAVTALNTDTGDQWPVDFPERTAAAGAAARDVMFMVALRTADGRAALYVTFMSGCPVYAVDLDRVDRCDAGRRPSVTVAGRKPYRVVVLGTDAGSRMYFRRPAENEIWSWDADGGPFHPVGFRLVSAGRDCRAPVHVAPGYGGFVFVLANNFGDYARNGTGSLGAYTVVRPVSALPPVPATTATATSTATATVTATTTADAENTGDGYCECPA